MNIVFVHGWGFHPGVWAPLSRSLPGRHHFIDLGFVKGFNGAIKDIPENPIVIGHSLGVMWALSNVNAKALVSIAGFDCFHRYVPAETTTAMKRNLTDKPYKQMESFWQACGVQKPYEEHQLDIIKLKTGLDWLLEWDVLGVPSCPTLALASKNDTIVRPDMSEAIWADKNLHWCESGGHILQQTQTKWCAEKIEEFLDGLSP